MKGTIITATAAVLALAGCGQAGQQGAGAPASRLEKAAAACPAAAAVQHDGGKSYTFKASEREAFDCMLGQLGASQALRQAAQEAQTTGGSGFSNLVAAWPGAGRDGNVIADLDAGGSDPRPGLAAAAATAPTPTPTADARQFASIVAETKAKLEKESDRMDRCRVPESDLDVTICQYEVYIVGAEGDILAKRLREAGEPPAEIADLVGQTTRFASALGEVETTACKDAKDLTLKNWGDACQGPTLQVFTHMDDLRDKLAAWDPYL